MVAVAAARAGCTLVLVSLGALLLISFSLAFSSLDRVIPVAMTLLPRSEIWPPPANCGLRHFRCS